MAGVAIDPGMTIKIEDAYNNVETGDNATSLMALIASGPSGASFAAGSTTNVTVSAGVATFSALILDTAGGGYTLTVSDTSPMLTTASSNAFTISPAAASSLAVAAPATATVGAPFNFDVTALDPFGNVATGYTGTVQFASTDGLASLPGSSGLTDGEGTFAATLNTAATAETISAADASLPGAINGTSNNIDVSQANTSVQLISSAPITGLGQSVTFTATVLGLPPSTVPIDRGTVTFMDGTTTLGTVALSSITGNVATWTTSSLTKMVHSITASYADPLDDYAPSTSPVLMQTVITIATITPTPAANPSVFGQTIALPITITGTGATPTGTVIVTQGALPPVSKTLSAGTATFILSGLTLGDNTIAISYSGDSIFAPASTSYMQMVNQTATTTVLSAPGSSVWGQPVTFTATVAIKTPGAGTLTGTVNFYDGAIQPTNIIGTGSVSGGVASFTTSALSVGSHTITAVYSGDANDAASTSTAGTQTVAPARTQRNGHLDRNRGRRLRPIGHLHRRGQRIESLDRQSQRRHRQLL